MERFHVRRGHEKKTEETRDWPSCRRSFDGATADVDGRFQASFGLMTSVTGEYAEGVLWLTSSNSRVKTSRFSSTKTAWRSRWSRAAVGHP